MFNIKYGARVVGAGGAASGSTKMIRLLQTPGALFSWPPKFNYFAIFNKDFQLSRSPSQTLNPAKILYPCRIQIYTTCEQ
jgi:hypothetical protein